MGNSMIGRTLGSYRILSEIGRGGMGIVYRAEDLRLGRHVALKVFREQLASDEIRLRRFEREAKAVAALNHPNIVTLYSIEEAEGVRFLTMELVEGRTLAEAIRQGFDFEEFLDLALALTNALAAAHGSGITHRDLKPANVMVSNEGRLTVLDFGAAKFLEEPPEEEDPSSDTPAEEHGLPLTLTIEGAAVGTLPYMSPEQLHGADIDPRSDIFALCTLLYEMATGSRLFQGSSYAEMVGSIRQQSPPPIAEIRTDFPPNLDRVLRRGLMKRREDRYQDVRELQRQLELLGPKSSGIRGLWRNPSMSLLRPLLIMAGVLFLTVLAVVLFNPRTSERPLESVPASPQSVAVMPFDSMSTEKNDEYFSAGMTEELINALVKIEGLQVPARTSVFALQKKGLRLVEVGEILRVAHVLEGSVRREGRNLRISAQLIRVADGYHLWSEVYNRELEDVFAIQDEISRAIVTKLEVELRRLADSALVEERTANLEAYNAYLEGRFHWNKRTGEGMHHAIELFQRAIDEDDEFALAHSGLADAYLLLPYYDTKAEPMEYLPKAENAVFKALKLDNDLAEAHTSYAEILRSKGQYRQADEQFRRALDLKPRYATAHLWYAALLRSQLDQRAESLDHFELARQHDPVSRIVLANLAKGYQATGQYAKAFEAYREVKRLDPDWPNLVPNLADVYVSLGRLDKALDMLEGVPVERQNQAWYYVMATVRHLRGEHRLELTLARRARGENPQDLVHAYLELNALAALGDEEAIVAVFDEVLSGPYVRFFDRGVTFPYGSVAGSLISITADELLVHGFSAASQKVYGRAVAWHESLQPEDFALDPTLRLSQLYALLGAGATEEALALWSTIETLSPEDRIRMQLHEIGFLELAGRMDVLRQEPDRARWRIDQLARLDRPLDLARVLVSQASIATAVGDLDRAAEFIGDAFDAGLGFPQYIHAYPALDALRNHPPFIQLVRQREARTPNF